MKKYNILSVTALLALTLTACTQPQEQSVVPNNRTQHGTISSPVVVSSQPTYQASRFSSISANEMINILRSDRDVILVDVRTPQEFYQDGRLANAKLIPLSQLPSRMHELDKSKKILVYCRSGNRSVSASQMLADNGYETYNLRGGILSWQRSRLPVVR